MVSLFIFECRFVFIIDMNAIDNDNDKNVNCNLKETVVVSVEA